MNQDKPAIDAYLCKQLIRSIAAIISNSLHNFWLSRRDATDAMNACYETLAELLSQNERIEFKIINSQILVNSAKIEETGSNTAALIRHLQELEVQNFTITREVKPEDFVKFLEILEAHPDELAQLGGFVDFLSHAGIKGITTRKVIIKEISDEEMVVDKKSASQGKSGPDIANIIAFLKGSAGAQPPASEVAETAANPGQMASLIMQAAQVQQAETPLEGGETLVDFVVGCLRKTFTSLHDSHDGRTKTGRKRITKNLLLLEEEIIKRMREMSEEWSESDLDRITEAVHEMTDEMKIDSIADEYISQRKMIEKSEAQLLDFIKSKGIENIDDIALKDRLLERGLSLAGWNQLVLKSSADAGAGPGDGSGRGDGGSGRGGTPGRDAGTGGPGTGFGGLMEAISRLDVLLDNMEKQFTSAGEADRNEHAEEIMKAFSEVNRQVDVLVMKVEHSVEGLIREIQTDSMSVEAAEKNARDAGNPIHKTRRQVLTSVAGIIRNISDPLAMINTSLEMIQSRTFGSVNTNQSSIILVAKKNADRIKNVLDRLAALGSN